MWRPVLASAAVGGLLLLSACGGSTKSGAQATPGATSAAGAASTAVSVPTVQPAVTLSVTLSQSSISPSSLALPAGVPVRVNVTNNGDPCLFSIGDYVRGLLVMQGRTGEVTFTPSAQPASTAGGAATVAPSATATRTAGAAGNSSMGCLTEQQRMGTFTLAQNAGQTARAASTTTAGSAAAGEAQPIAVRLDASSIQPSSVNIVYDQPEHVTVQNTGAPCLFYFGDYLRGLQIGQNQTADATFVAPGKLPYPRSPLQTGPATATATATALGGQLTSSAGPPSVVTLGCIGDVHRQAKVNVPPAPSVSPGPTPSLTPVPSPNEIPIAAPNTRQITITDNGLNPNSVSATATQPVELQVTNQSSTPCTFSIEGFIQPQTIQPGQSATITFNVAGAATQDRPMGCQGSSARQGVFRLVYSGVLPAGR